jgi:DNA-binding MarR family transcriptional regulator
LIWFLNHHPVTEIWSPFEEAGVLGYTDMTATRAVRELLKFGLFELEVRGRAKYLKLVRTRRELWEMAKPLLRSPILRTLWTYDHRVLSMDSVRWAGETALAGLSMLNEPQQPAIAITAEAVQHAKQQGVFFEPRPIADGVAVQVWRYRPNTDAKAKNVDLLSLWLSLRDNKDNRVQIALDEIEAQFPW